MKTKKLTKWEIATMLDEFERDLGHNWRMPPHVWVDMYTRAELVEHYNFMVRIHYMGRKEIS